MASLGAGDTQMRRQGCRFCNTVLQHSFADLGMSPLANSYVRPDQLKQMEPFYPLHAYVCERCLLVQLEEFETPEHIFSEYAYFSSHSESWIEHARAYTDMIVKRFGLDVRSRVVEIASNDGYLLQHFVMKGISVLGIDPATNVARVAIQKGIRTLVEFFGREVAHRLAKDGEQADLLLGNNMLAHVPDIHDFVQGMKILLKPQGVITMEFPHLLRLMAENQFDTIYHEHFSYFSFSTAEMVFKAHGLTLFDVEELTSHGGSLRIFARHSEDNSRPVEQRVFVLRAREEAAGLTRIDSYLSFVERVKETKRKLLDFLITTKGEGKSVVGYGAPAKGNTLFQGPRFNSKY